MNIDARNILVSVIVPVYNGERFIKNCVDSIINQTHSFIEIILVDDGSTDSTGEILDRFKSGDSRIVVIHKENSGVSSSRNVGIENSSGEYIVFVDGDDFLSSDFVEYLLGIAINTGSVFCLSKNCYKRRNETQVKNETVELLSSEKATALLLSPDVVVGCWNKIFRRDFIIKNDLRFSTELFYGEGLNFIITAAQKAETIGVSNKKIYYYRRNNDSSATTKFNIEKIQNGEKSLKTIKDNLVFDSPLVNSMYDLHLCTFLLGAMVRVRANHLKKMYKTEYKNWKKQLKIKTPKLVFNKRVSFYRKLLLIGGCVCPGIMTRLDIKRRNKNAALSI